MRNFIAPPYFANGNPLNAYGVNQIIEAVNVLESEFLDFKMLRPKILMKRKLKSLNNVGNKNGFVLLKNFSHLRVAGTSGGGGTLEVYLRRIGKNDVQIGSGNLSNFDILIHLNNLADPPLAGEIYIIYLTSSSDNVDVTINYLYEFNNTPTTKIEMPTINASTVIDQTYLNKFVDNIRQIVDLSPSNAPFRGVGGRVSWSTGDSNFINQFAKWEGVRINNFLRMRFRTEEKEHPLVLKFKIIYNNVTHNIGSFAASTNVFFRYDYLLNFTNKNWTITNVDNQSSTSGTVSSAIDSIPKGSFYEFLVEGESNSTTNKIYIDYVLESKNPL